MDAKELYEISRQNQITIENILKQCENQAKQGYVEWLIFNYIAIDTICDLAKLGFKISEQRGDLGQRGFLISWL
ncbi:hypothetical protein CCP3SC1AL1_1620004 [Gammaproteobacteria bacterium]